MRIVIPSAGLGSRFLPLTRAVPKELLLLGEWPLIHHALLEAEGAGFDSAIIVISPMKRAIRTYFEPAPELERDLAEQGNLAALARLLETQSIARRMKLTEGYAALTDGVPGVFALEFSADSYDCGTPQEFARATTRYAAWSDAGRLAEVR